MPSTSQLRLMPIEDDDLFEEFCRDLWSLIWGDPHARRHGRKGQAQQGVDIYGQPQSEDAYEGIQAKAVRLPLTDTQIQREINEAKKFDPPLRCLYIATTAGRDTRGQAYVRNVNLDHRREGLFRVDLLGWEDIERLVQQHMAGHPEMLEQYFAVSASSTWIIEAIQVATERIIASIEHPSPARIDVLTPSTLEEQFHQELNFARSLIAERKPRQALDFLSSCRERLWRSGVSRVRYRVLHYSGSAKYQLGRDAEAGRDLIAALQYQPDDEPPSPSLPLGTS